MFREDANWSVISPPFLVNLARLGIEMNQQQRHVSVRFAF
jgi:hypothetical protein